MNTLIGRNTTIPTSKSQTYTTADDNQTSVEIHVLQGERPMASDNKSVGKFILDGILPAPRGLPKIEVTFDIDANGILSVEAKDQATGREQKIVIQPSSGLAKSEIDQMVIDAEQHADDDRSRLEEVDLQNSALQAVYSAEKLLKDNPDQIPADLRMEVEAKVAALRTAQEGGEGSKIRTCLEELTAILQQVGAHVYQQASENENSSDGAGPDPAGNVNNENQEPEGTVEGEFREV